MCFSLDVAYVILVLLTIEFVQILQLISQFTIAKRKLLFLNIVMHLPLSILSFQIKKVRKNNSYGKDPLQMKFVEILARLFTRCSFQLPNILTKVV